MAALKPGRFEFDPTSIVELRKKLDLTQQELAEKLGITKAAISRWEQGKPKPDASALAALYSVAMDHNYSPNFFRISAKHQGVRSRLIVAWDYQNLPSQFYNATAMGTWVKQTLEARFSTTSYRLFKVFASPFQSWAVDQLENIGWRLQVFNQDIDDELWDQSSSDCGQNPSDTIFVLITRDGDFTDLIQELRKKQVRVHLLAPEDVNERLIEAVGKRRWITMPPSHSIELTTM